MNTGLLVRFHFHYLFSVYNWSSQETISLSQITNSLGVFGSTLSTTFLYSWQSNYWLFVCQNEASGYGPLWMLSCWFITCNTCGVKWTWWRHQMETFSALLAICVGNSPGTRTKASDAELWCFLSSASELTVEASDLRRYRAHYDVSVMKTSGLKCRNLTMLFLV